jgi:ATP-binding cassette subfamily B protein
VAIGNRIGVLDEGRIIQESTYDQLTQEPRLFQSQWEL